MDRFTWTKHQNKKILSIEVCQDSEEEALVFLKRFVHELSGKEEGDVHLLADLRHARFWPKVALEWQKHQHLVHSRCAKLAVLGAMGIISVAVETFLHLAQIVGFEIGRNVRFFENFDLAKEWLVDEEEPSPKPVS
jgi:hypothetical protein